MKHIYIACGLLLAMLLGGCTASTMQGSAGQNVPSQSTGSQETGEQEFYAMDTVMSIRAYGGDAQKAVNECMSYINNLETLISRTREDSEISKLNAAEGKVAELSQDTADILARALELSDDAEGYFDPTVANLSDLWNVGGENPKVPAAADITVALKTVGYDRVKLDGITAQMDAGMKIDLGGIGKGYAADQVVAILKEHGVEKAVVALGGNIYVVGEKEEGVKWSVGITDPDDPAGYLGKLSLSDTSIVTSGDYERYFEQDGVRYCHIFDPATGYPAQSDLRSVTIVGTNSTQCDAFSTALFVMGHDKALEFCKAHGVEAVLVRSDKTISVTDGLKDSFELTNSGYTYEN